MLTSKAPLDAQCGWPASHWQGQDGRGTGHRTDGAVDGQQVPCEHLSFEDHNQFRQHVTHGQVLNEDGLRPHSGSCGSECHRGQGAFSAAHCCPHQQSQPHLPLGRRQNKQKIRGLFLPLKTSQKVKGNVSRLHCTLSNVSNRQTHEGHRPLASEKQVAPTWRGLSASPSLRTDAPFT